MKKYFEKIKKTNHRQVEFGKLLGLDFSGLSVRVSLAMLKEITERDFNGMELKMATEKQITLGKKFDLNFSNLTVGVASAHIKDILEALNFKSIEEQNIKSGDCVVNKYDKSGKEHIVSSIGKEAYLYFKKSGGGAARHMIKINRDLIKNIFAKYSKLIEV